MFKDVVKFLSRDETIVISSFLTSFYVATTCNKSNNFVTFKYTLCYGVASLYTGAIYLTSAVLPTNLKAIIPLMQITDIIINSKRNESTS